MQVIPAILEKNFLEAEKKIGQVLDLSRWIQIDTIDGKFHLEKSFELELINSLRNENEGTLWEVHLMVKEPINWIEKCYFIGASRVIGQVEMMVDRDEFIKKVKDKGMEAGLAFDIDTEIDSIPEETEVVLLLGRKSGFGGGELNEIIFERIEKLKKIKEEKNLSFQIAVDGGVNKNNIEKLKKTGVDIAYCGGAIFDGMVKDNLDELERLVE